MCWNNLVPITVYYESLCSDTIKFFLQKLIPTYGQTNYDFANLLSNMELVPYGKVKVIDAELYQYSCQHGPSECLGNKLNGCAVKYITDKKKLLNYIGCLMWKSIRIISSEEEFPVEECQDKIPEDLFLKIAHCYNTNEGWHQFNHNGHLSNEAYGNSIVFIPLITFNNVTDGTVSNSAYRNFRRTLCSQNGIEHAACSDEA
ncbi:GILT-like protein 1 isoform X2 [Halyomorpha halys]|uniref:GILT-like protein 1 isoform X2 n=1 Tax=Halyomorpha halys TaxID=286706 RepID=UPI0034D1FC2F